MYSYYGLSAIPFMRPFLWWKKHITQLQLVGFAPAGFNQRQQRRTPSRSQLLQTGSKTHPDGLCVGFYFIYLFIFLEYFSLMRYKISVLWKQGPDSQPMVLLSGQNPLFESQFSACGKQMIVTRLSEHSQVFHSLKMLFSSDSNYLPTYRLTLNLSPSQPAKSTFTGANVLLIILCGIKQDI